MTNEPAWIWILLAVGLILIIGLSMSITLALRTLSIESSSPASISTPPISAPVLTMLPPDNNVSAVRAAEVWVQDHIQYKPQNYTNGIVKTLEWGYGDCTDRNMVARFLLKKEGFETYPVYGYCKFHGKTEPHDWSLVDVVVDGTTERIISDTERCEEYIQIGYGVWGYPWDGLVQWKDEDFNPGYLVVK